MNSAHCKALILDTYGTRKMHYNFQLPLPACTGNGSVCQALTLPLQESMLCGKHRGLLSGHREYEDTPELSQLFQLSQECVET